MNGGCLMSLLLALTLTPTLSQSLVRRGYRLIGPHESETVAGTSPSAEPNAAALLAAEEAHLSGTFGRLVELYSRVMQSLLKRPWMLTVSFVAIAILSIVSYRFLGNDLLPKMDEGGFILDYFTPPGSSLAESNKILLRIEEIVKATPEVENTSRRTGLQLGLAAVTEANRGDFTVKLKKNRKRAVDEVISDIRLQIEEQEPATKVEFVQILQDMIGDLSNQPEPIVIQLFSQDGKLLNATGPRVAEAIGKISGVVDVLNGVADAISGPAVTFQINPAVAARSGFTPEEVAVDAAVVLEGEPAATPVILNDLAYTIRVRFPEQHRSSLDSMSNALLTSSTGRTATLGSLATISVDPGQTEIRRENLQRLVQVTGRFEGVDLGTGIAAVQKAVDNLHLPSSIRVEYGGLYAEERKSSSDMLVVLFLRLLLLFAVLLFEFRTFSAPTAILASALLSSFGGFLALLITNTSFNLASRLGLIMVIG